MKLLIALCVAAAAAQPVVNPTIRLKKPETNTTVNIEWDGYQLTIPQHTDKIAALETRMDQLNSTMTTGLAAAHSAITALSNIVNNATTGLAAAHDKIDHGTSGLAAAHEGVSSNAVSIATNDADISANAHSIVQNSHLDLKVTNALDNSPLAHHLKDPSLCPNGTVTVDVLTRAYRCLCEPGYAGGGAWQQGSALYPACTLASCPTGTQGSAPTCGACDATGYTGTTPVWSFSHESWSACTAQTCPPGSTGPAPTGCSTCGATGYTGTSSWDTSTKTWSACSCATGYSGAGCTAASCPTGSTGTAPDQCSTCDATGYTGTSTWDASVGAWSMCGCDAGYEVAGSSCTETKCGAKPANNSAFVTGKDADSPCGTTGCGLSTDGSDNCYTCTNGFSGTQCNECAAGKGFDGVDSCVACSSPQYNNQITHDAPCADQLCDEGYGATADAWDSTGTATNSGNCEPCATGQTSPADDGQCTSVSCHAGSQGQAPACGTCDTTGYTGTSTWNSDTETWSACSCATGYTGATCQLASCPAAATLGDAPSCGACDALGYDGTTAAAWSSSSGSWSCTSAIVGCPTGTSRTGTNCAGACDSAGYTGTIAWQPSTSSWSTCTQVSCPTGTSRTGTNCAGACDSEGYTGTIAWQSSTSTWSTCTAVPCPTGTTRSAGNCTGACDAFRWSGTISWDAATSTYTDGCTEDEWCVANSFSACAVAAAAVNANVEVDNWVAGGWFPMRGCFKHTYGGQTTFYWSDYTGAANCASSPYSNLVCAPGAACSGNDDAGDAFDSCSASSAKACAINTLLDGGTPYGSYSRPNTGVTDFIDDVGMSDGTTAGGCYMDSVTSQSWFDEGPSIGTNFISDFADGTKVRPAGWDTDC